MELHSCSSRALGKVCKCFVNVFPVEMCLLECASVSGRNDTQPWDSGNGSEGRLRSHSDRGSQLQNTGLFSLDY